MKENKAKESEREPDMLSTEASGSSKQENPVMLLSLYTQRGISSCWDSLIDSMLDENLTSATSIPFLLLLASLFILKLLPFPPRQDWIDSYTHLRVYLVYTITHLLLSLLWFLSKKKRKKT